MTTKKLNLPLSQINGLMEGYAKRGVFRGFSKQRIHDGVAAFKLLWHRNRVFDLIIDTKKKTVMIPVVLPCVPDNIYEDFKAFVQSHHAASLPDHRRIEKDKARLRCAKHSNNVSVALTVREDDYEYALQRLIHLIHETFVIFLLDGRYHDYLVEQLGEDPDW